MGLSENGSYTPNGSGLSWENDDVRKSNFGVADFSDNSIYLIMIGDLILGYISLML